MKVKTFMLTGTAQEFYDWLHRYQYEQFGRWPIAVSALQADEGEFLITHLVPLKDGGTNGVILFRAVEKASMLRVTCQTDNNPYSTQYLHRLWQALRRDQFRVTKQGAATAHVMDYRR